MKNFLLVILSVMCHLGRSDYNSDMLQVSVFYESKCPDSRRFITEQLTPAIEQLQDYIALRLVPFGKADSISNGNGGFSCQHGPSECLGNRVQDCALYNMQDRTDTEKVAYVACEMQTMAGTVGNYMCVKNANLPVDEIRQCVTSEDGTELQLISEQATKVFRPKFIPTITFNDEFNQQAQNSALVYFFGTVCSFMKDAEPCTSRYNYQPHQYTVL